jgi:hypothetical protein
VTETPTPDSTTGQPAAPAMRHARYAGEGVAVTNQPNTGPATDPRPAIDQTPGGGLLTGPPDQTPGADPPQGPARKGLGVWTSIALLFVVGVWVAGCVWSFEEQTAFARSLAFQTPRLLPLAIDGMAVAMAAVAFAASLDARPSVPARAGAAFAVLLSAGSNATWAFERSSHNWITVTVSIVCPVAANLAFEVLLGELRKQVMRTRGVLPPVAIPYPRALPALLSPFRTFSGWRRLVLEATDLRADFDAATKARQTPPPRSGRRTPDPKQHAPRRTPPKQTPDPVLVELPDPPRRTPTQTPAGPPVQTLTATISRDETDLVRLRVKYHDRTPSINEVQDTVGGGRSRAIRLRGLVHQTPDPINGHRFEGAAS